MTASPLPELEGALFALDEARSDFERTSAIYEAARDVVHDQLRVMGSEQVIGGDRLPAVLVSRIYWEYPEVHASAIGAAIGVPANVVHQHAGRAQRRDCRRCGSPVDIVPASRTNPGVRTGLCATCTEQQSIESRIDERGEAVTETERGSSHSCYEPDGTFSRACTERLLDASEAWRHGGAVNWLCDQCGRITPDTLVVWVPPTDHVA